MGAPSLIIVSFAFYQVGLIDKSLKGCGHGQ